MKAKVIRELKKLGFSLQEANTIANKYPKTIAHADLMGSLPHYPAFQMLLAEQGREDADVKD